MVNLIRQARQTRGMTAAGLNAKIREKAYKLHVHVASQESLRVMISAWENGRQEPDAKYRRLLQQALGLPAAALGFGEHEPAEVQPGLAPLVRRGAARLEVSDSVLGYFRRQFTEHVQLDNIAGPGLVLDVVDVQLKQVRRLANRGPAEALVLASHFTEYAGWLHQDSGDPVTALRLTDEAVDLADAARDPGLTAYTLMRKSNVLTGLGQGQRASLTARRAVDLAAEHAPDQEAVCLRQVALAEAAEGDETAARTAVERALVLLETAEPSSSVNALSPYCTPAYVEMEHALCLLMLDQPAAAEAACTRALDVWPTGFVRDEGLCLVRLAVAQLRMNELDAACGSALRAIERVELAPSARTLEQLRAVSQQVQPFRDARCVREFREALAHVA